jgi:YVTN family beta-propeller protein
MGTGNSFQTHLPLLMLWLSTAVAACGGSSPAHAGVFAYIPNSLDATVSVIDTATNTVTATIPVMPDPVAVAVAPAGDRVYIGHGSFDRPNTGGVSVIDASTNSVIRTLLEGRFVRALAVHPSGSEVYAVYPSIPGAVIIINAATLEVTNIVTVRDLPYGIAVAPDGNRVYVNSYLSTKERRPCNPFGGFPIYCDVPLFTFNPRSPMPGHVLPIGDDLEGIAIDPFGRWAYIANLARRRQDGVGALAIVDLTGSFEMLSTQLVLELPENNPEQGLDGTPQDVAVHPAGERVYVTQLGGYADIVTGLVNVVDAVNKVVIAKVPVGANPSGISLTPDGARAYVVNACGTPRGNLLCPEERGTVSVIDTSTNRVVDTVRVGKRPVAFGQFIQPAPPPMRSPPPTPTPRATPTMTPTPCVGDCNNDGSTTVDELIACVAIALGAAPLTDCYPCNPDLNMIVTVDELVLAVNVGLHGCER